MELPHLHTCMGRRGGEGPPSTSWPVISALFPVPNSPGEVCSLSHSSSSSLSWEISPYKPARPVRTPRAVEAPYWLFARAGRLAGGSHRPGGL